VSALLRDADPVEKAIRGTSEEDFSLCADQQI